MVLYGRDISITMGARNGAGIEFYTEDETYQSLNISFNVRKSTNRSENTCSVTIHNMNILTFDKIQSAQHPVIRIMAGYKRAENIGTIFLGDITELNYKALPEGGSVVSVEGSEGLYAKNHGMLRKSYPEDTKLSTVISDCKRVLENLGITVVDEFKALNKMANKEKMMATTLKNGYVASDYAINVVANLVKNHNYKVYVNNDVLVIAPEDAPLQDKTVYFSKDTGLVGTAVFTKDGTIKFTTLLDPRVSVGSRVQLFTDQVDTTVVVKDIVYKGSSLDGAFQMDIEGVS